MKYAIHILMAASFFLCSAVRILAQEGASKERNIRTILEIFRLIEQRDPQRPNVAREMELVDSNVEMNWPRSLPYGGTTRGMMPRPDRPSWGATWTPLQPTAADRKMDPRVVGANDHEVAVLYRQRGLSPAGERYDGEVLGLYEIHGGKLTRAQMFYFDEVGAVEFLRKAKSEAGAESALLR